MFDKRGICIVIDCGGIFIDCVGEYNGEEIIIKLLFEDFFNYKDVFFEGICCIMGYFIG